MVTIVNSEELDKHVKMLLYGASGVGKTVFGSTAPDVLFLDAEAGMLSVREKNLDRIKVIDFADVYKAFDFLKLGEHKYKTVVIDSLTEIQRKSMDSILKKTNRDKPQIQDWGSNIEQIRKMVRYFRDLPMNVIVIGLDQQIEQDDMTGTTKRAPALQGRSLPQEVMGYYDIVGYMFAQERVKQDNSGEKEIVRAIRVQPSQNVYAKDRSGKLPIYIQPNFVDMFNTIFPEETNNKKGEK